MQVHKFLFGSAALTRETAAPVALTIGNFDSVHRGHQGLIRKLKDQASSAGLQSAVLTFEPHPRAFLTPYAAPLRLSSLRDKLSQLRASGVDQVYVARFDGRLANLEAGDFVRRILVEKIGAAKVMIGDDFHFGRRRQGNLQLLETMGAEHGFSVAAMETLRSGEDRISSSRIREALMRGETELAERLLGRPYAVSARLAEVRNTGPILSLSLQLGQASLAVGGYQEVILSDDRGRLLAGVAYASPRPVRADGLLRLRVDTTLHGGTASWLAGARLHVAFLRRHQAVSASAAPASTTEGLQQGQPG